MSRTPIVIVIAFLYISPPLAASDGLISDGFQYTPAAYHEGGFDGAEANAWMGLYGQFKNENTLIEEIMAEESLEHRKSALGTSIGFEFAPLYGTYGVFRTTINRTSIENDESTYLAIGITADELSLDGADSPDSRNEGEFSYGFGVNNSSYNIEYMVYMDEENYGVSAISLGFISEF